MTSKKQLMTMSQIPESRKKGQTSGYNFIGKAYKGTDHVNRLNIMIFVVNTSFRG